MSDFDEKDIVQTVSSDFDPADVHEELSTPNQISKLDSALAGAKQGASFGLADEGTGLVESGLDAGQALLNKLGLASPSPTQVNESLASQGVKGDVGPQSILEAYRAARDAERFADKSAQQANPLSYTACAVAGGLATAPALPAGVLAPLGQTAKNAGLAAKIARGAVNAAPVSALVSAGMSEGDLTTGNPDQALKVGKDIALGTATGMGVGGTLPIVGAALKGTGNVAGKLIPERVKTDFQRGLEGIKTSTPDFYTKTVDEARQMVDDVASPIVKKAQQQEAAQAATIAQADDAINAIQ